MDGYELLASLRSQPVFRDTPIIMITSRANEKHRIKAFELGGHRLLDQAFPRRPTAFIDSHRVEYSRTRFKGTRMLLAVQLPTSQGLLFSMLVFFAVAFCPIMVSGVVGALTVRLYKHQDRAMFAGILAAIYVGTIAWWILASPVCDALSGGATAGAPILVSHVFGFLSFGIAAYRESKHQPAQGLRTMRGRSLRQVQY